MVNLVQCNFVTNVQNLFSRRNEASFTFVLFCPVQTDSKFSHGWLSYLSWLDPRDLSKGLWSLEWRVKIVHRKDSDRLPGYFVLRSGCQIVQGAVLTPASTLILGSSTGWVVHLHFFLQQIIFCKIATLGMGGEGATVFVRFAFYTKEDYLKINVLVLVIRTSRSGLFWY